MGKLIRWNKMIKWDEIIEHDKDDFSMFLQNYWELIQVSTRAECGDDWTDENFALTKAYLFLFGVVNWYGRQHKLSIPDTFARYMNFLVDHVGLSQESAQELVGHISFLVESSDDVHPYLRAGEKSVQEFVDGNQDASRELANTLLTQEPFGVWADLSARNSASASAAAF